MTNRYRIPLVAGVNLIAFPGDVLHPQLSDIFPAQVLVVLGYRNEGGDDDWETAAYGEDDEEDWNGSLVRCEAGHGYWVIANAEGVIDVPIAPLPEYRPTLANGWNLIGYAGDDLSPVGQVTRNLLSLDEYLEGIDWRVAHVLSQGYVPAPPGAFDSDIEPHGDADDTNDYNEELLFQPIHPNEFVSVMVGRGYWVWVGDPGEDDDLSTPPGSDLVDWVYQSDPESRMGGI